MSLDRPPATFDDLVCDIEDLEEWLSDLEAKAYSAATQLEFLPYIPTAARKSALHMREAHPDVAVTVEAAGGPVDFSADWQGDDPDRARSISGRLQSLVWATAEAATKCARELTQIRTLAQELELAFERAAEEQSIATPDDGTNGHDGGWGDDIFDWPVEVEGTDWPDQEEPGDGSAEEPSAEWPDQTDDDGEDDDHDGGEGTDDGTDE